MLARMQNTGYSVLLFTFFLFLFCASTVQAGKFDNNKGKRYGHFKMVDETTEVMTDTTAETDTTTETGTTTDTVDTNTTTDTGTTDVPTEEPVMYSKLTLGWSTPSDFQSVIGYYVYYGKDMSTFDLISDISIANADFDIHSPSISFDIALELGSQPGETACFQIKSYSERETSSISDVICSTI